MVREETNELSAAPSGVKCLDGDVHSLTTFLLGQGMSSESYATPDSVRRQTDVTKAMGCANRAPSGRIGAPDRGGSPEQS
ncbi:MAG: hypothetical protein ABSG45_05290 [Nitrososphaerales archaeon]